MNKIHQTEQIYGSPEKPWRGMDGRVIACAEKLKVMRENFAELRQAALDVLEDAVLMGCDETQVKEALFDLIQSLSTEYKAPGPSGEP
ncbi:MAG: hypothetical protein WA049_10910 [Ferribacterium limneticum]